jgi:hypothetical protein
MHVWSAGVEVPRVVMHCQRSNREHMESRFLQAHLLPYKHCSEGLSCAIVRRHKQRKAAEGNIYVRIGEADGCSNKSRIGYVVAMLVSPGGRGECWCCMLVEAELCWCDMVCGQAEGGVVYSLRLD